MIEEFKLDHSQPSIFVLGAGASYPLPTAWELKSWLVAAALRYCGEAANSGLRDRLKSALNRPFLTLEALFSLFAYRLGPNAFPAKLILESALRLSSPGRDNEPATTRLALLLAKARQLGLPFAGPIVTTNFDITLMTAHDLLGVDYSVVTLAQIRHFKDTPAKLHGAERLIIPIHGTIGEEQAPHSANVFRAMKRVNTELTVRDDMHPASCSGGYSDPSTAFARGLARAFTGDFHQYLKLLLGAETPVIAYGYRGADEYDFNILLSEMITSRNIFEGRLQWFSWKGDGTDLSDFARENFAAQIVTGSLEKSLEKTITDHLGAVPNDVAMHTFDPKSLPEWKIKEINSERFKSNLNKIWSDHGIGKDQILDIALDLESNLLGAWVALEHYYLESVGFNQDKIQLFGGGSDCTSSTFKGVDFSQIVEGQRQYRLEQDTPLEPIDLHRRGYSAIHKDSFEMFTKLESDTRAALVDGTPVRPIDRAIVLIARAAAVDYQGLILRNRSTKALDRNVANEFALRSIELFEDCKHYAERAARAVGRDPQSNSLEPIDEITGWRKWRTIAMDNIPRARELIEDERIQALDEYTDVIDLRFKQLEEMRKDSFTGDELIPAHIPQLMLRISEYLKCAQKMGFDTLSSNHAKSAEALVDRSFELFKTYFEYTFLPIDRGIALLEALSYFAIYSNGCADKDALLERIIKLTKERYDGHLSYRRCGDYMKNWAKSLTKLREDNKTTALQAEMIDRFSPALPLH